MKRGSFIILAFLLLPVFGVAGHSPDVVPGYIMVQTELPVAEQRQRGTEGNEFAQWLQTNVSDYDPVLPSNRARGGSNADTTAIQRVEDRLARTYKMQISPGDDPREISHDVRQMEGVVYAEPWYNYELQDQPAVPNDSRIGQSGHDYFEYHRIFDAWSLNRSSSSIVIAIVDSGVYYDHPELTNKLWRNPEPGRPEVREVFPQVRNDTIGWNFWQQGDIFDGEDPVQNADPVGDYNDHGTHVAGIAAAEPNNGLQIAGTGYHAQFMPVKVGGTKHYPRSVPFGIQGILYAALNGADVINASFGTTQSSEFARDVITYANELGSVVIGAAGNNANSEAFYPAGYPEALSVGAVDNNYNDVLSGFSSFGYHTDTYAIGSGVYSTSFHFQDQNGARIWRPDYRSTSGTSMATPVVSGIAALIRDRYPDWPPDRVRMQIRNTSESIVAANASLNRYYLGQGRLNAFKAVSEPQPGIEVTGKQFTNEAGGKLDAGETGSGRIDMINHGEPLNEVLVSSDNIKAGFGMTTERTLREYGGQYRTSLPVDFSEDFDLSEYPEFILKYRSPDGEYEDFFPVRFDEVFHDRVTQQKLSASFSSDGLIGYRQPQTAREGEGIHPEEFTRSIIEESGLLMQLRTDDRNYVVDAVRHADTLSRHFVPEKLFRERDGEYETRFRSTAHPDFKDAIVEMQVHQMGDSEAADQTMLLEYRITNPTGRIWENVYAGLFTDWSLYEGIHHAGYSEPDSLHHVYVEEEDFYVALSHIGPVSSALAIDNESRMTLDEAGDRQDSLSFGTIYGAPIEGDDGFTRDEKKLALTAGTERTEISAGDLGTVSASGPYSVEPGEEITLGFVLAWAKNRFQLRNQVAAAREQAPFEVSGKGIPVHASAGASSDLPEQTELLQNYPNPFNPTTTIPLNLARDDDIRIDVYDVMGRRITTLHDEPLNAGRHTFEFDGTGLASGVYIIVAQTYAGRFTRTVTFMK